MIDMLRKLCLTSIISALVVSVIFGLHAGISVFLGALAVIIGLVISIPIANRSRETKKASKILVNALKAEGVKILINGPIEKKFFLKKKYPGMTEYFAAKAKKTNEEIMLIYNKNLAVSPVTTHLPLKRIFKKISKKRIIFQVKKINEF